MQSEKVVNITEEAGTDPAGNKPKIIWDDSEMHSIYSNVGNVTGGREEIILLFGQNHAWHTSQKAVKIQLSNRIVMNPFAAKRLSVLLNNVLNDYESRFGKLENIAQQPGVDKVEK